MNDSRPFFITRELQSGFLAPIECLRFFKRHKFLLVSALAPHVLALGATLWAAMHFALPWAQGELVALTSNLPPLLVSGLLGSFLLIAGVLLFAIVGSPLLNVLLSPLLDVIAAKAYVETSGRPIPDLGASDFLRSLLSEASKAVIVYTVIAVGFFLPMLLPGGLFVSAAIAPVGLLVSIWFFGWDNADRTLALLGWPLRRRIAFGMKHFLSCIALGVWAFVPLAGTLLSFTMAAAGAMVVARAGRGPGSPESPASATAK